jgi:UDP-GlcNAc:undecaprenyl-phosphate/decaprenyl-phosphate GlcNAc-1-phosphate transferase
MTQYLTPVAIAFLVSITLLLVLRPVAFSLGLLDVPGGRKTHSGEVPVIGGIAMFLASLAAISAVGLSGPGEVALLVAAALMVLVGALDDRFDLPPYTRILAHIAAAVTLVMASGFTVESFGDLLGFGAIGLGPVDFMFTIVATIALINGFNMLDGLDGLAGGVAFVALSGLAAHFIGAGQAHAAVVALSLVGAIGGFLIFNLPAKFNRPVLAFMGDAGSTYLGFALAGISLIAIQPAGEGLPPVVVLWLMPVPILELFASTIRRAVTGLSPMQADRGHFHHRLLDAGFSVRAIFLLYLLVSVISAFCGLFLWRAGVSEAALFYAFAGLSSVWLLSTRNATRLVAMLPASLKRGHLPRLRRTQRAEGSRKA